MASRRPRLLIVEDSVAVLEMLRVLLGRESIDIAATVDSAEAALALSIAHDFDIVLLDDRLDGPTRGVNLVPMLRELRPRIKIVLFSATAELDGHDVDAALAKEDIHLVVPTLCAVLGLDMAR